MATANAVPVHPSNADQLQAWDGDQGVYWTDHADHFDRAVAAYHERLLSAAAITDPERVLDIGCGTGQTTRDAARATPGGTALGVDLSARMLDLARRRASAEGVANASFAQVDAQIHPFPAAAFDVAISRTGAMFFGDPVAAFGNLRQALAARGRIVLVAWQGVSRNEWFREMVGALAAGRDLPMPPPDAPGPFALSDPDRIRTVLTESGFAGIDIEETSAGMWFGTDPDDADRFMLGQLSWMLHGLDAAGRSQAEDALHATTAAHQTDAGVVFGSAAWLIRATRHQ